MKKSPKGCVIVKTTLGHDLDSFQSKEAKRYRELISIGVDDAHTEIDAIELERGSIIVTITDADLGDEVVKMLNASGLDAKVVDRKKWLLEKMGITTTNNSK
jgi:hypothetical protein